MLSLVSNQQYNVSCASSSLFEKVRWSHEACKRPVSRSHQASWLNGQGQLWMLDYCKKGNPWFSLYPTSYDHENKSKPLQEKDYHWDQRRESWSVSTEPCTVTEKCTWFYRSNNDKFGQPQNLPNMWERPILITIQKHFTHQWSCTARRVSLEFQRITEGACAAMSICVQ